MSTRQYVSTKNSMTCHIPDMFLEVGPVGVLARNSTPQVANCNRGANVWWHNSSGCSWAACWKLSWVYECLTCLLSANLVVQDVGNIITGFLLHQHRGCQYVGDGSRLNSKLRYSTSQPVPSELNTLRPCCVQGSFEFSWRTQRFFFRASSGSSQRPNFNAKEAASQPSNQLSARFQDPTHLVICIFVLSFPHNLDTCQAGRTSMLNSLFGG